MKINSTERIPQTHRTILFDSFTNSAESNLARILERNSGSMDEREGPVDEVRKLLEVFSFEEFLEKFTPVIYQTVSKLPGGLPVLEYSDKPGEGAVPVEITRDQYYEMLTELYRRKGSSKQPLLDFDDRELLKMLAPQAEIEKIYKNRSLLDLVATRMEEKREKHEDYSREKKQFLQITADLKKRYTMPQATLLVHMADTDAQLEQVEKAITSRSLPAGKGKAKALPVSGRMDLDDNGRPVFIPLGIGPAAESTGESGDRRLALQDKAREGIRRRISKDFDEATGENGSPKIKEIMVSAYAPALAGAGGNDLAELDEAALNARRQDLRERKSEMLEIYRISRQNFITALNKTLCRLIDVKIFFGHSTGDPAPDARLDKGLIVANCDPGKLVTGDNHENFKKLMGSLAGDTGTKRVWFGILPQVSLDDMAGGSTGDDEDDDPYEMDYPREEKAASGPGDGTVSLATASELLSIMDTCRVTTVFSFAPADWTTFSTLTAKKLREVKEKLNKAFPRNGHAVCAYPNFTLLGRKEVKLDEVAGEDGKKEFYVQAGPVEVGAAYVGAGLLAASQQRASLEKYGLPKERILRENVMVRVDLGNAEISRRLLTHFTRERLSNWPQDLMEEINADGGFGLAFCGNEQYDTRKGAYIENTYVHCANSMKKSRDGFYQPIVNTLMTDFLTVYLNLEGKLTKEKMKAFFKRDKDYWLQQAKSADATEPERRPVNLIVKTTDTLELDPEVPGKIRTNFGAGEESVTVTVEEAEA